MLKKAILKTKNHFVWLFYNTDKIFGMFSVQQRIFFNNNIKNLSISHFLTICITLFDIEIFMNIDQLCFKIVEYIYI